jgi:orotidine-5'-phosphate decarboxylase
MDHFADRLAVAVQAKGNSVSVGLDPRWELLPEEVRRRHGGGTLTAVAQAYEEFCGRVIDVVAPLVPAVKAQSAFFEVCGAPGWSALQRTLARAQERGLLTIWDGKRNDIAATAAAYAQTAFTGMEVEGQLRPVLDADALTVNPYLGRDAVEPFLRLALPAGRGVFVLVRTSNPGAGQFQDLDCGGRPLFMHVAEAVGAWARESRGECGLSAVGAVVGATYPAELAAVRRLLPDVWLLLPGYGSQGGAAADTAPAFREDGLGALVNNSRGIIFSFSPEERNWEAAVATATHGMIDALASATSMRRLKNSCAHTSLRAK